MREREIEQRRHVFVLTAGISAESRELLLEHWDRKWRRRLGGGDYHWIDLDEKDGYERFALAFSDADWEKLLKHGEELIVVETAFQSIDELLNRVSSHVV